MAAAAAAVAALAFAAGAEPTTRAAAFDEKRAFALLREQVELGPRPAGSAASRKLAQRLRALLPNGRFQAVPNGLRNVIGVVPGRNPKRTIVVGAHYDTKDLPGFVGANDGASGHRGRGRARAHAAAQAAGADRSSSSSSTARRRRAVFPTPSSSATGYAAARSPPARSSTPRR